MCNGYQEISMNAFFSERYLSGLVAAERLTIQEVLSKLDYTKYFDLLELPLPANRDGIVEALSNDGLIQVCPAGGWDITNLGAILFAKRLTAFPALKRKIVRVIQYRAKDRTETVKEHQPSVNGYATGFEELVNYINGLLPSRNLQKKCFMLLRHQLRLPRRSPRKSCYFGSAG